MGILDVDTIGAKHTKEYKCECEYNISVTFTSSISTLTVCAGDSLSANYYSILVTPSRDHLATPDAYAHLVTHHRIVRECDWVLLWIS